MLVRNNEISQSLICLVVVYGLFFKAKLPSWWWVTGYCKTKISLYSLSIYSVGIIEHYKWILLGQEADQDNIETSCSISRHHQPGHDPPSRMNSVETIHIIQALKCELLSIINYEIMTSTGWAIVKDNGKEAFISKTFWKYNLAWFGIICKLVMLRMKTDFHVV